MWWPRTHKIQSRCAFSNAWRAITCRSRILSEIELRFNPNASPAGNVALSRIEANAVSVECALGTRTRRRKPPTRPFYAVPWRQLTETCPVDGSSSRWLRAARHALLYRLPGADWPPDRHVTRSPDVERPPCFSLSRCYTTADTRPRPKTCPKLAAQ